MGSDECQAESPKFSQLTSIVEEVNPSEVRQPSKDEHSSEHQAKPETKATSTTRKLVPSSESHWSNLSFAAAESVAASLE
jgi:hypothetical protein